jgi:thiol:disulfide interchange protein DsbD
MATMLKRALIALFFLAPVAQADFPAKDKLHTTAQLISEVRALKPGQPFTVALRLKMEEHWHTYWKYPGESGLATKIDWDLPEGFTAGPLQWPVPQRTELAGIVGYGYEDEVWLLTDITPPAKIAHNKHLVNLKARVSWLECADMCIPGKADVALTVGVSKSASEIDPAQADAFAQARARLPLASPAAFTVSASAHKDKLRLLISPAQKNAPPATNAFFFSDKPQVVDEFVPQKFSKSAQTLAATLHADLAQPPARVTGLVLIETDAGSGFGPAIEIDVPVLPDAAGGVTLWTALALAFLGGLILNLMPCVLPVLSLKILGFVNHAHGDPAVTKKIGMDVFTGRRGVILDFGRRFAGAQGRRQRGGVGFSAAVAGVCGIFDRPLYGAGVQFVGHL